MLKAQRDEVYLTSRDESLNRDQIYYGANIYERTQPNGKVEVKNSKNQVGLPVIKLSFTFPDGIQTVISLYTILIYYHVL
ncbi:hypothetical protein MAR_004301 [Mya arenaria]|uniref:Uncharacterized protein n=1 Tax=Mya arenaria TaxID=6604 RepID=A0ABY7EZX0_MYAAR|nr:hypothetical protein MAR_004301 [Mya arenaria]